jgi:hypothetical protein
VSSGSSQASTPIRSSGSGAWTLWPTTSVTVSFVMGTRPHHRRRRGVPPPAGATQLGLDPVPKDCQRTFYALVNVLSQLSWEEPMPPEDKFWDPALHSP